jgi:hypothetical protein
MALQPGRITNVQSNQSSTQKTNTVGDVAIVYSVILDDEHPLIQDGVLASSDVGSVECRPLGSVQTNELIIARPKNPTNTTLPIRNQTVHLTKVGSDYFYDTITKGFSPNTSALSDAIKNTFPGKEKAKDGSNSKDYSNSQKTGIVKSSAEDEQDVEGFGDYFEGQEGIHKLKLYEGDTVVQSRFGQSIRFSGYNNTDNEFSPTITIRNGESAVNRLLDIESIIEEDVNRDGTIIQLGSGEYILPFQPGTVDDGGTSDFETSPDSFAEYPSELKGDQLLLNSGRIILSAKNAEMIFYSKKNYGFISDGTLSIDNKFGIEANVGDDINVLTNDKSINLNTGNGNINLGNQELEPLVKGDTLLGLLEELIDAINTQVYLTPSGPSATGPTNIATFNSIKSKLKNFLSTLNTTA